MGFFGGMDRDKGKGQKGWKHLFPDKAFFHTLASLFAKRLRWIHPVSICYMVWTFARAEVVIPEFLDAVADHLCNGHLPMLDRCGLGTLLWAYSNMRYHHKGLFVAALAQAAVRNKKLKDLLEQFLPDLARSARDASR